MDFVAFPNAEFVAGAGALEFEQAAQGSPIDCVAVKKKSAYRASPGDLESQREAPGLPIDFVAFSWPHVLPGGAP